MLDLMYKKVSRVIPEIEWKFHAEYIEEINIVTMGRFIIKY